MSNGISEDGWCVIANWKMNKTCKEAKKFVEDLMPLVRDVRNPVWIAAPFTSLGLLHEMQQNNNFVLGAQNMNDATSGAFTGEIAAVMLKEAGASFVLLGHSERRLHFHESDEFIAKKVARAIESELIPVLCIGETFEEKGAGKRDAVLEKQLKAVFNEACPKGLEELIIAYEPVWAIGTGLVPGKEDIEQAVVKIQEVSSQFQVKSLVLYGGSVGKKNVEELASISSIHGFLVGGASLESETFAKIATISENIRFQSRS